MPELNLLDMDEARRVAASLKVIPGFPWGNEAVEMIANCLVGWCRGILVGNVLYTPAEQAGEIAIEAVHIAAKERGMKWDDLGGISLLYAVYEERFLRPSKPPEQVTFSRPAGPACQKCDGTGWELVRTAKGEGSRRCSVCKGTGAGNTVKITAEVCPTCLGKSTILVDRGDRRMPCPACSTAAQQRAALGRIEEQAPTPALQLVKATGMTSKERADLEAKIAVEMARQGRPVSAPGSSPAQLETFRQTSDRRAS